MLRPATGDAAQPAFHHKSWPVTNNSPQGLPKAVKTLLGKLLKHVHKVRHSSENELEGQ